MSIPCLNDKEFSLISSLVYDKFGINLTEQKKTLVIERLQKTLRQGNFNTFKEYYEYVISDHTGKALLHLVDRISTNHTYFFREQEHYNFLKNTVLPGLVNERLDLKDKKIRIWSAGCSSGEEAYTTAIVLREFFGSEISQWDIGILATDISTSVLEKALSGSYLDSQMAYMPDYIKKRYFIHNTNGLWDLDDEIKKMVTFKRLNLMSDEYPFKGLFDIIFCRNVMIYFDNLTRNELVRKFHQYIIPNGYLYIGHSESLNRDNELLKYIKPAIYQKR